jgi:hypothetical protein
LKRRRKNGCEFRCSRGRVPHFSSSSLGRLLCYLSFLQWDLPIFNKCYKSLTILHFGCVFCCLYPTWHDSARIDFSFQRLSDSLTAWCNAFEIWTIFITSMDSWCTLYIWKAQADMLTYSALVFQWSGFKRFLLLKLIERTL